MYKILIADDEMIECKVLEKMIREHFPELQILPSVFNGVDFLHSADQNKPDIAVLDIAMPGLNGLDVLEILKLRKQFLKIIVVSAYSKFEYAQKALNLGASEYLLKPVDDVEFVEIIRQTITSLDQKCREFQKKDETELMRKERRQLYENILISDILLGSGESRCWEKYFDLISSPFMGGILINVRAFDKDKQELRDVIQEAVYAEFLQLLKKTCRCFSKIYQNVLVVCVLPSENYLMRDTYSETLFQLLEEIISKVKFENIEWLIGISDWKYDYQNFSEAYQESKMATISRENGIFFYSRKFAGRQQAIWNPLEVLEFLKKILTHDAEMCRQALDQILDKFTALENGLELQKIFCGYLLYRVFREYSFSKWYFDVSWKELFFQENEEQLLRHMIFIMMPVIQPQKDPVPENKHMVSSRHFIEKYFAKDLSLENVADSVGITNFYLSRLFKQESGKTFLEILTNCRIRKALEFLYEKRYSVQEISEQIGYQNVSYFYKIFKKQTGMTIGEFKEYMRFMKI